MVQFVLRRGWGCANDLMTCSNRPRAGTRKRPRAARTWATALRALLVEVAEVQAETGPHFYARVVRITAEGVEHARPVWEHFARMLAVLSQHLLQAHFQANEGISARIRSGRQSAKALMVNG
jgi:hypothetical protein